MVERRRNEIKEASDVDAYGSPVARLPFGKTGQLRIIHGVSAAEAIPAEVRLYDAVYRLKSQ